MQRSDTLVVTDHAPLGQAHGGRSLMVFAETGMVQGGGAGGSDVERRSANQIGRVVTASGPLSESPVRRRVIRGAMEPVWPLVVHWSVQTRPNSAGADRGRPGQRALAQSAGSAPRPAAELSSKGCARRARSRQATETRAQIGQLLQRLGVARGDRQSGFALARFASGPQLVQQDLAFVRRAATSYACAVTVAMTAAPPGSGSRSPTRRT